MSEDILFDSEEEVTGPEAARVLRALATGLAEGTRFQLGGGADAVTVVAPDELELEIELERAATDDDPEELELELELEWYADTDTAVRFGRLDLDDTETTTAEGLADNEDDPTPDDQDDVVESVETGEGAAAPESGTADPDTVDDSTTNADPSAPVKTAAASKARFQLYQDRRDEWRWRLRHQNGNIIATGAQGYSSRRDAKRGLESVKSNAFGAPVDTGEQDTDGSND